MEELASVGLYAISRPDEPETMAPDLTLAIQGAWIRGNGRRAPGVVSTESRVLRSFERYGLVNSQGKGLVLA